MRIARHAVAAFLWAATAHAAQAAPSENARLFGAREFVQHVSLSPDGRQLAYIIPAAGQGTRVVVQAAEPNAPTTTVLSLDGEPERALRCDWVSDKRLSCLIYGVERGQIIAGFSRNLAVDIDGRNPQLIGNSGKYTFWGGRVIDWLVDTPDKVLMFSRGVVRVDTTTGKSSLIEPSAPYVNEFISDGRGEIRIRGFRRFEGDGYDTGINNYFYRRKGAGEWLRLSSLDSTTRQGFDPYAVDPALDAAYGLDKVDGLMKLFRISLDGSLTRTLVASRPDVDIEGPILLGRHRRPVGATFVTDTRHFTYFDPQITALKAGLHKALPDDGLITFADAIADEQVMLVFAGADTRPGVYHLLDRRAKTLKPVLEVRPELSATPLGTVRPVSFPSADGTMVPGYLTLPPGSTGRNIPAIVMPHGGPGARDEWGFDWFAQFFAAQGYAVLQPNFRGSTGYGDAWFKGNGYKAWRTAMQDIASGGRWLIAQGIADPQKLGIVGWSYGGYAALQTAITDPSLFRAVVAVAPVTDLGLIQREARNTSDQALAREFFGGRQIAEEASPARFADRLTVPVLLFHGERDLNVDVEHSRLMAKKLQAAGRPHRLVTWEPLDHGLHDSAARTQMLDMSDAWLKAAFAGQPFPEP
jgi:dipeptidyl aminopeptidase/acylaminoacyl peptidase